MTERRTSTASDLTLRPSTPTADRSFGGVVRSVFGRVVSVLPFVGSSRGVAVPSVETYVLRRPSPWRWQMLMFVFLPTAISAIYFGLMASGRYTSETQAVVSAESNTAGSILQGLLGGGIGGLLGGGGGGSTNQGQILVAFVQSTEMLQELEDRAGFSKLYMKPEIDFFSRLPADSPFERRYDYFKRRVSVEWDGQSQIVKVRVEAFNPSDAQNILKTIISLSEKKLNAMAVRQHKDLVNFAESELGRAEDRLSKARLSVEDFRRNNSDIDPIASAQAVGSLVSSIQEELATARGKKAESLAFMRAESPQVLAAEARIAELENETKSALSRLAGPEQNTLSDRVSKYESLLIEEEFARTAYTSAMAYFESARAKEIQSSSYVLDFVPPFLPQFPTEPKPFRNTIVVFVACLLLLGVGNLIVISVREQARF
jgi:capsular polysaccharide transport system permease protein